MNEAPPTSPPPATILAPQWAVRLGAAVLVGFALILGCVCFDHAHRGELETVSETTAVGDTRYFPAEQVTALQLKPFEIRDSHLAKGAQIAGSGLTTYALAAAATTAERKHFSEQPAGVLVKTGVNQYVVAPPAAVGK